ncbi:MAG: hypothetical protein ACYCZY_04455 [Lacisediminihabitans sp.]
MRKPLALLTIAALSLALAACSTTTGPGAPTRAPTQSASSTPTTTPTAREARPALTKPLVPLTDTHILSYCPDVAAVHFEGLANQVTHASMCTSTPDPSTKGTTESAYWVNFGLDQLLAAYSVPNATASTGACASIGKDPFIVWLTGADGVIHAVYAPVDGCGLPTDAATAAYRAVGLQVLYEVTLDANGKPVTPTP